MPSPADAASERFRSSPARRARTHGAPRGWHGIHFWFPRLDSSLDRALKVSATSVERATLLAELAVATFTNAPDRTHQENR